MSNQKGQGLIEYLLIVSIIAISTVVVVKVVGQNVRAQFANISQVLRGEKVTPKFHKVNDKDLEQKDMSNFFEE